jgi:hypothetical protein
VTRTNVYGVSTARFTADVQWRTILLVGAGVALFATVGQWLVAAGVGLWIRPVGLAVVAAGVVAGRPARWGVAGALFLVGLLFGGPSVGVVWAIAGFAAAAVSTRLWVHDERPEEGWGSWALRYVVVAVAGVLVLAATSSWLLDVLGRGAFSLTVGETVVTNLPLAAVGAPLVRLAVGHVDVRSGAPRTRPPTATTRAAVILVALCWTVGGYVGSFLFRVVEQIPSGGIARELSPAIEAFVAVWGWQGTYAQLVLGLVSLTAVALLLRR